MVTIVNIFGILVLLYLTTHASACKNFEDQKVAWWFIQTLPSNTGPPAYYYIDDTMSHAKYYEGHWYDCENGSPLENTLKEAPACLTAITIV
jgi:hypothetical protein